MVLFAFISYFKLLTCYPLCIYVMKGPCDKRFKNLPENKKTFSRLTFKSKGYKAFCLTCFTGDFVIGIVGEFPLNEYLKTFVKKEPTDIYYGQYEDPMRIYCGFNFNL